MALPKKSRNEKRNYGWNIKSIIILAYLIGSISGYVGSVYIAHNQQKINPDAYIQLRFSPRGNCLQLITQTISMAQKTILVHAYAFTSLKIADALIEAKNRGIDVKILVDRSQIKSKGSQVKRVLDKGIPIYIDVVPGIAHNKVIIIDNSYVLTGSFNWSNAAEYRNAENLLLIRDSHVNNLYKENWDKRYSSSISISSFCK